MSKHRRAKIDKSCSCLGSCCEACSKGLPCGTSFGEAPSSGGLGGGWILLGGILLGFLLKDFVPAVPDYERK